MISYIIYSFTKVPDYHLSLSFLVRRCGTPDANIWNSWCTARNTLVRTLRTFLSFSRYLVSPPSNIYIPSYPGIQISAYISSLLFNHFNTQECVYTNVQIDRYVATCTSKYLLLSVYLHIHKYLNT